MSEKKKSKYVSVICCHLIFFSVKILFSFKSTHHFSWGYPKTKQKQNIIEYSLKPCKLHKNFEEKKSVKVSIVM